MITESFTAGQVPSVILNPVPVEAKAPAPNPSRKAVALEQIIRADARERWSALITAGLTPERVEQILRGALTGDMVSQWELFQLMEDTWPMLGKCLAEIKEAVQTKKFSVVAYKADGAKEPSARAKAKAELLEAAMLASLPDITRDENAFEDALYDACDAFGKGVSVQEILWEIGAVNGKQAILPRAFKWVHPSHYGFPWLSQRDDRLMLCPEGHQANWIDFPENKFIIARFKTRTGHLLGGALMRSLARFWIGANFAYDWALNLAQMFGIPIRWATYDPNNSKLLDEICDMLQNLGSAGWGAFPHGTTLELKEAIQRAADNPQAFIMQIADTACSLLILGQTLTSNAGERGTQALGTVHMSVREQRILYVAGWLAKTLNYSFVSSLMFLNFGNNEEDPWLEVEQEEVKDAKAMAERDKVLINDLGMQVSRDWLYQRHEIPIPEDGEEIFEPATTAPTQDDADGRGNDALNEIPDDKKQPGASARQRAVKGKLPVVVQAKSADEQLAERMLEDLTGLQAKWLGGVKPFFVRLVEMAKDESVSDAQFIAAVEASQAQIPELAKYMDRKAVEDALVGYMNAGLLNGVARGVLQRGKLKGGAQ